MENLVSLSNILIESTDIGFVRFMDDKIDWGNRFTAILGARGTGKTTLLLQHIKLNNRLDDTLYVNADDFYFSENKLFDLANDFWKSGGKHLYIDEIHKYPQWSKELKMMFDYFPDLQIIFTGSSILDIYKGSDDLSRRVLMYLMPGMSFREYLELSDKIVLPAYSLEEILQNKVKLSGIEHPLPYFKAYLQHGYYPFYGQPGYLERLRNVINQILEIDIPTYVGMNVSTAYKLKQLMYILSQSVPFKPNFTKIAQQLGIHRNQVADYILYMEKAGILNQLRNNVNGLGLLGKVEKVYLNNPNLIFSVSEGTPEIGTVRETFFINQMSVNHKVTASEFADFTIGNYTFEVGGKHKNKKQIAGIDQAFVVKDDIEYGFGNTIPLWAFGLNY
jgi:predicted AAA+ superfamily ATPase